MAKSNQELTDALSAPLGEFISAIGKGLAEAQQALDMHTIESFRSVYQDDDNQLEELRRMGYQPTWYKIPELTAEIQMALSISATALEHGQSRGVNRANKFSLLAAPVDASYMNSYNFNIQGSSKVKFTIVPVPASPQAENIKVVPFMAEGKTLQQAIELLGLLEIPYQFGIQPKLAVELVDVKLEDLHPSLLNQPLKSYYPVAGTILQSGQQVTLIPAGFPALTNQVLADLLQQLDALSLPVQFADLATDHPDGSQTFHVSTVQRADLTAGQLAGKVEVLDPRPGSLLQRNQLVTIMLPVPPESF